MKTYNKTIVLSTIFSMLESGKMLDTRYASLDTKPTGRFLNGIPQEQLYAVENPSSNQITLLPNDTISKLKKLHTEFRAVGNNTEVRKLEITKIKLVILYSEDVAELDQFYALTLKDNN